jgi:outer membrane protein OmpA-like peptidoglycan-associated protein
MRHRFLCFALTWVSFSAFAAESNILAFKPEIQRGDIYQPHGLWPLLGIGMGSMSETDTRTGGATAHAKVLGSYYFDAAPVVADAGLGVQNEFLTQSGTGSDSIQSVYTEFAGRYVFTNRWQLGAIWNTLVDTPHRYQSNSDSLASFIGAQALKEFTWNDAYLVRVGGRAMTSLGLKGGSVNSLMAELEVSFGDSARKSVVAVQPAPVFRGEMIAPHLAARAMNTFDLDPKLAHFSSNSTKLVKASDTYVKRLARVLADNHQLFNRVEVIGHADQRGTDAYNDKLSHRRAETISEKLVAAGVKSSQILSEGKGKRQLLTHSMSPSGLQRNRRVQLEFIGVKNREALKNVIDSVAR